MTTPPGSIGGFVIGKSAIGVSGESGPFFRGLPLPPGNTGTSPTTVFLDPLTWDITIDPSGNIALATGAYAIAQDVASACRLFKGELWYDTTLGLPYFENILGKLPSVGFMIAKYAAAADTVPDVQSVKVTLNRIDKTRVLTGKIEITNTAGATATITAAVGTITPWYVSAVND